MNWPGASVIEATLISQPALTEVAANTPLGICAAGTPDPDPTELLGERVIVVDEQHRASQR